MTTAAQRQAEYKARMRAQGFALVAEWIPDTERARFKAVAAKLRKGEAVNDDKITSNKVGDGFDWARDRIALEERIKREYDYDDLVGLAITWWMKTDPASLTTEEALDGLALCIHDNLDEIAMRAGLLPEETTDRFVEGIRQAQLCRMDAVAE